MARLLRIYQDLCLRSAYGTFPYCATPKGLANTVGLCPTPHVRHVAGVQATPTANTCTPTTDRWVASDQSRPQPLRGCFASLDSSPAPRCWTGFLDSPKHRPRGRFRKRNLKHAKECSIQQRRGFACGVCRWKRRFGCSRNSAVSAARFESGFRERDGQGQHWRGPHSHGGFLKMIVCESGGHANGLTYFIFRFLRRPHLRFCESQF